MSLLELSITGITAFFSAIAGIVSFSKNPRTPMKVSFSIMAGLIFLGNLGFILDSTVFQYHFLENPHTAPTILVFFIFSLLLFGLQFPTYFRTYPILSVCVSLLFGSGSTLLLIDWALSTEMNPLASRILLMYFYPGFYGLSYTLLLLVVSLKLRYSFPAITKFISSAYLSVSLAFLATTLLAFHSDMIPTIEKYFLHFFLFNDIAFIFCFLAFMFHYSFSSDYLTHPFSFIFERQRKIFESYSDVSLKGSRELKEKLWRLYDEKGWQVFMDSFWFQILVDETLDNALEHGGKRGEDTITVHVFESKRFIDFYVIDRGKGFNPRLVPSPLDVERKKVASGRGIHILKRIFIVRWNFLGNEINIRIDKLKGGEWSISPNEFQ